MSNAKERRHSGGKPPIAFDPNQIEKLAALGSTLENVAFFYDCSVRTVERHVRAPDNDDEPPSELWKAWCRGRAGLQLSLRQQQLKIAMGSSKAAVHMLIHLSKHQLGESDKALLGLGKDGKGSLTFVIEG